MLVLEVSRSSILVSIVNIVPRLIRWIEVTVTHVLLASSVTLICSFT